MNEKTNDGVENNNSMGPQEKVGEKIDQTKDQENKIFVKKRLDDNDTSRDEGNSENNETISDKSSLENKETSSQEGNLENIDSLKKELSENKDKLLRSLAESENTRKQMEKIRIETNKYGVQPLAREILNVVDNFNRALNIKDDNKEKSLEEGFTLIQKEILSILDKFNVKKNKCPRRRL